jgi:hypothetical protein
MSSLQRLAAVTDTTANLIAQLRELEELRERVRKVELARRSASREPVTSKHSPIARNPRHCRQCAGHPKQLIERH